MFKLSHMNICYLSQALILCNSVNQDLGRQKESATFFTIIETNNNSKTQLEIRTIYYELLVSTGNCLVISTIFCKSCLRLSL